jgi:hypothetical protein
MCIHFLKDKWIRESKSGLNKEQKKLLFEIRKSLDENIKTNTIAPFVPEQLKNVIEGKYGSDYSELAWKKNSNKNHIVSQLIKEI